MMSEPLILHRRSQNLIAARLGLGVYAFLKYEVKGGKMYIKSTYTPPEFRGRGLATRLTEEAVRLARETGLKVVPECSFAVRFFKKRRELWSLLAPEALDAVRGS